MVNCVKLGVEAPGLERAPLPGELGEKIYASISADAWQQWLQQQTILINEYRLKMTDASARAYLAEEMEKFLFSDNYEAPAAFKPE